MRLFLVALSLFVLTAPAGAGTRRCGDDAGSRGRPVPCACGDILVGSRTLGPDDPITQGACDGPGLRIQVPAGHAPVTLNLAGQTIAGGRRGIGILVVDGGAAGVTIVGPGTLRDFETGLLAPRGLAALRGVTAADNATDGFILGGDAYEVRACEARGNGRDGFSLRGSGPRLDGNRATGNGRHGFQIAGRNAALGAELANEGTGNRRDGLHVRGRGHVVAQTTATANGGAGIRARGTRTRITGVTARDNAGDGVHAAGEALLVSGSVADQNGGAGIHGRGARISDGGDNHATGNRQERRARTITRGQCTLGAACR